MPGAFAGIRVVEDGGGMPVFMPACRLADRSLGKEADKRSIRTPYPEGDAVPDHKKGRVIGERDEVGDDEID